MGETTRQEMLSTSQTDKEASKLSIGHYNKHPSRGAKILFRAIELANVFIKLYSMPNNEDKRQHVCSVKSCTCCQYLNVL